MAEFLLGPASYKYEYKLKWDKRSGKMFLFSRNNFPIETDKYLPKLLLDTVAGLQYTKQQVKHLSDFAYIVLEYKTTTNNPIFVFEDRVVCDTEVKDLDTLAHQMSRIDRHDFYHEIRIRANYMRKKNLER